jgi:anaerobic magnesium-protoporphyrin IX monomethyl ester cyclase
MRVALVYPPSCDPTAPYLAVPTLTAWLRKHDVEVLPIDANLEGWLHLLTREHLEALATRIDGRLAELEAQASLSHEEQLVYAQLWRARGDAAAAPHAIASALDAFRDPARFYDDAAYEQAVATVDAALRVISAAHAPLSADFVAYRTPFSLLTPEDIARDAAPDRDPFAAYFDELAARLAAAKVDLVGLSVAFPGQIQPAFALAYALRRRMPELHVTVGGPALTQMFLRLDDATTARVLGPFSSAVVYEGELALLDMVRALEKGEDPCAKGRVIRGRTMEDMSLLPPPDFDGMPLARYLAPELVLPYDPTRGCYWGVCTFCHYGLAEVGTAKYRERPAETILDHLAGMHAKYKTKIFYFSQDVFSPRIATNIARGIKARGLPIRWGTDMRPERSLTLERCTELVAGGALSTALGVESASPRVLSLIDKGIPVDDVRRSIQNLSKAGVAVEAMCFSDFPTETYKEAIDTVRFVRSLKDDLSLFILGRFDLTHGSLVAQKPGDFGIDETWHVEGDMLKTGLFFAERRRPKSGAQQERLEAEVHELSATWRLHRYPWAGALSTAHTMLYYARFGAGVFRTLGPHEARVPGAAEHARVLEARFDVAAVAAESAANEGAIWEELVHARRKVSAADYHELAAGLPRARPAPGAWCVVAGEDPERAKGGMKTARAPRTGSARRPSHATNSTKA